MAETIAPAVRILAPGEEAIVERFLARHAPSSMILRANLRARGLAYGGGPMEGVWAAAFAGDEPIAVAAHFWNDNLIVQAPRAVAETARAAVRASGRPLRGFLGPWEQVVEARAALGLAAARADLDERETLFHLDLAALVEPEALRAERVLCRRATAADRALMVRWRVEYHGEALGRAASPEVTEEAAAEIGLLLERRDLWVLEDGGRPVACTAFNARLPDCVQVGGVWTPPALRGRRYARAAVAGSLRDARAAGATASVLFTAGDNAPARRAYTALGYRPIGEYGLVLLAAPANPVAAGPRA